MKAHLKEIWVQKSWNWFWAHSFRLLSKHDLSVEPSPSLVSEFEHDSGSGPSPSCPGCCLLRAGPPGRAGLAEVPIAPACSVWRWRGGEKFHRSASGQENLSASCWRQQRRSGHLYRPGAGCLRVPTASARASSFWWKSLQTLTEKYGFIQSKEGRFDVSFRI